MIQIVMYSNIIRKQALEFRKTGKTYTEIQDLLEIKIPKSTLSNWFAHMINSSDYFKKVKENNFKNLKRARVIALKVLAQKRNVYLKELASRNSGTLAKIDLDIQKLILSILYLSEGAKYKSSKFMSLANSNPEVILLFINLLTNCFKTSKHKFRTRVQIRADQDVSKVETYWQKITNIPRSQFYPTYIDKRTKGNKTKKKGYQGVCTIYYFSTDIQLELEYLAKNMIKFINSGPVV